MKQFNYDSVIFNHEYPFSHLLFYSGIKTNVVYSFYCKKHFFGGAIIHGIYDCLYYITIILNTNDNLF